MPRTTLLPDPHFDPRSYSPKPNRRQVFDVKGNPVYVDSKDERVLLSAIAEYTYFDSFMMTITSPVMIYRGSQFGVEGIENGTWYTTRDPTVWIPRGRLLQGVKRLEVEKDWKDHVPETDSRSESGSRGSLQKVDTTATSASSATASPRQGSYVNPKTIDALSAWVSQRGITLRDSSHIRSSISTNPTMCLDAIQGSSAYNLKSSWYNPWAWSHTLKLGKEAVEHHDTWHGGGSVLRRCDLVVCDMYNYNASRDPTPEMPSELT